MPAKSNDEIARELANPNNSLASLKFRNEYRWYTDDLPGADNQDNYTLLFQPVFPFSLPAPSGGGKANFFVRPAFPLVVEQPVPSATGFGGVTALGDIGFDAVYGVTEPNGLLWAVGMVGTLPTATDSDVAGKQLRLGPEGFVAQFEYWGLYGVFPSHQWNVAGWGDSYPQRVAVAGGPDVPARGRLVLRQLPDHDLRLVVRRLDDPGSLRREQDHGDRRPAGQAGGRAELLRRTARRLRAAVVDQLQHHAGRVELRRILDPAMKPRPTSCAPPARRRAHRWTSRRRTPGAWLAVERGGSWFYIGIDTLSRWPAWAGASSILRWSRFPSSVIVFRPR